jgi:hypothetical protein
MIRVKDIVAIIKSIGSKRDWEGNGFVVRLKSQWLIEYEDTEKHRTAELSSEPLIGNDRKMHRGIYLKTIKWRLNSEQIPASDDEKSLISKRIREALTYLEPSAELIEE